MEIFISTWISSVLKWIEAQFVSDGDDIFIIIWSKWFLVICGSGFPCGCFSFFSSGGAMRLPRLPRGDKELRREEAEALWKIVPKLSVSISSASPPVSTGRRCDRSAIFETDIIGSGQHMAPSAAPKWSGVISTLILWQWTWWTPLPPLFLLQRNPLGWQFHLVAGFRLISRYLSASLRRLQRFRSNLKNLHIFPSEIIIRGWVLSITPSLPPSLRLTHHVPLVTDYLLYWNLLNLFLKPPPSPPPYIWIIGSEVGGALRRKDNRLSE